MKIKIGLAIAVSVLIGNAAQASVVKTLEASGTLNIQTIYGAGFEDIASTQAILDSSGVLSFTISDARGYTQQVTIHGVFGGDGLFTPQSDSSSSYTIADTTGSFTYGGTTESIYAVGPYEIQERFRFNTNFVVLVEDFTFSEVCPATNAPAGCGGPIFASAVPVPAAAWLFGSGLVGLIATQRRRVH